MYHDSHVTVPEPGPPRILLIEPETAVVEQIIVALLAGRDATPGIDVTSLAGSPDEPASPADLARCRVIDSMDDLHGMDLGRTDLVICACTLRDGCGLDALAYLQGTCPEIPVILTGDPSEASLAVEAVHTGAADFIVLTGHESLTLPLVVEKCLAQHRLRVENERLQADLGRSLAELAVTNRELQATIRKLEVTARTDELTRLSNRHWLNLMLEGRWAEAMRNDLPLAFVMIDLDGFKALNDRFGHQHGDELLQLAGRVIQANCRTVDVAARYGGDEFCILMPHTSPQAAISVAQRLVDAFEEAAGRCLEQGVTVGMSAGVAHRELSRPGSSDEIVRHADEALYAAKASPVHRVFVRYVSGSRDAPATTGSSGRDSATAA